jgi:hypothetical protein
MAHTVESIRQLLRTNDRAVGRALLALNARQTADEQQAEATKYHNEQGFKPCHAKRGTGMAQFYQQRGYLTSRQSAFWRATTASGKTQIEIYANQLLKIAKEKAKDKQK